MTRAVGIFGSDAAAKRLHAKLRSERVYIERHNFRHPDDMLSRVYEEPDIAAVLLVEKALKELDPDIGVTLEYIRAGDSTVRIIFIKDEPERDYDFELWCYERGIYDVAYPSRHTDVNIDAIRDAVLRGRIDPDNPPPLPPNPNAEPEQAERVKLRNRINLPSMPNIKFPEWKIPSFFERLRKPEQDDGFEQEQQTESPASRPQATLHPAARRSEPYVHPDMGVRTIGVINSSRGFGATSLIVSMAECLLRAGRSVAVVSMDFSPDLGYSDLQEMGAAIVIPSADELSDWNALYSEHDFILIDFGAIYDFLPSGDKIPAQASAGEAIAVREALSLCDMRLYLASSEPWHKRKAKEFEPDDKGYVIHRQEANASEILLTIGVI